jgi:hypothetical protein
MLEPLPLLPVAAIALATATPATAAVMTPVTSNRLLTG